LVAGGCSNPGLTPKRAAELFALDVGSLPGVQGKAIANADKQRRGSYSVPIRFQRQDVVAHARYGQTLSGTIPATAAHDVYEFDAQAGDIVHISGPGCDIGSDTHEMTLGFTKSDGTPYQGTLDCTDGTRNVIDEAGTYRIVVNFANRGPGRYSFVLRN
jgi:hypothetical protein